jgi:hypothetical protein
MATVVNRHKRQFDVYIGRGTAWGNPFTSSELGRALAISMFESYIRTRLSDEPELLKELMKLDGKLLGCSCKPKACHGDVLVKIIKEHRKIDMF